MASDKDSLTNVEMAGAEPSFDGIESVKRAMIERVAHQDEYFVHLRQRGEPDMPFDERIALVEKLLANSPGEFLARFGATLTEDDLLYFDTACSSDYTVHFRTSEIRQRLNDAGSKLQWAVVKNRRYMSAFY